MKYFELAPQWIRTLGCLYGLCLYFFFLFRVLLFSIITSSLQYLSLVEGEVLGHGDDVWCHSQHANESLIKFLREISNFLDQPPWSHFETNVTQKHKIKLVWPNVYRVQLQIIMTYGGIPPEYYIILHLGLRNYNQFYRVISEKINQYCQLFLHLISLSHRGWSGLITYCWYKKQHGSSTGVYWNVLPITILDRQNISIHTNCPNQLGRNTTPCHTYSTHINCQWCSSMPLQTKSGAKH